MTNGRQQRRNLPTIGAARERGTVCHLIGALHCGSAQAEFLRVGCRNERNHVSAGMADRLPEATLIFYDHITVQPIREIAAILRASCPEWACREIAAPVTWRL